LQCPTAHRPCALAFRQRAAPAPAPPPPQVWRIATCFLFFGKLGIHFFLHMFFA